MRDVLALLESVSMSFYTSTRIAGVAELADAQDSGSCEVHPSCGFESHLR